MTLTLDNICRKKTHLSMKKITLLHKPMPCVLHYRATVSKRMALINKFTLSIKLSARGEVG
jgi:hypothetical protein